MTTQRPTPKQGFSFGKSQTPNRGTEGVASRASGSATLRRSQTRLFLVGSSESGFRRAIQAVERIFPALAPSLTFSVGGILDRILDGTANSQIAISVLGAPSGMNQQSGMETSTARSGLRLVKGESLANRPGESGSTDMNGHRDGVFRDLRHDHQ